MQDNIEVICPIYNAQKLILELANSINKQKDINIKKITYLLTESSDNTENILIENNINFIKIKKTDFSHSLSREKLIFNSSATYVIMITQDIIIEDEYCFSKLYNYAKNNNTGIAYLRQKGKGRTLDKYFRLVSYPKKSYVYTKNELEVLGQDACFCSDACSIYNVELFKQINGYDNLDLNTNEDMYYAYKLLSNNNKVGYCSDSFIYHTHKLTLKETYNRYKEIGTFFKNNPHIGDLKGSSKSKYLKTILYMLRELNLHSLIYLPFNIIARLKGMKAGRKA